MTSTAAFLRTVFGNEVGADAQIVVWSKRSGSQWCSSPEDAAESLDRISGREDAYYGVNLQDPSAVTSKITAAQGHPPKSLQYYRGYASTVSVMPGLWVDIDVASGEHKKKGLPASIEEATAFLGPDASPRLPFEPTLVVRSGGGLHLYWLFDNPMIFEDDEDRGLGAALIRRWQDRIRTICGYTVDATHDLSRVLRPAGTTNHKYGNEVTVESGGPRYTKEDLITFVEDGDTLELVPDPVIVDPPTKVKVDTDSGPPAEKLLDMITLHPTFAATWRRERTDLGSQSEYDLSLASLTARSGWTPDEIAALILDHRRRGGEDLKLDRPRYYQTTIAKAMAGNATEIAQERLEDRVDMINQGESTVDAERIGIYTDLSAMVGVHIIKIIRYVADPPQYRLIMEEGSVDLGGTENLLNSHKFRVHVAGLSGRLIPRFTGQNWDPIAQAILRAAVDEGLGADSTSEGLVAEWMGEYFEQHRPEADKLVAVTLKVPYWDGSGPPGIFLGAFLGWLGFYRNENMGRKRLGIMLRSAGCQPRTLNYKTDEGDRNSAHIWSVPTHLTRLTVPKYAPPSIG